ncbi:ABC transporter permease [Virgisporangium aliadipatigenens]|uniref:ABC transporter permease n=1 Tax=Virgisporangium aliadipatigenens TaxID=741659 RepID=A0A8J4DT24_9ACTN|nr:ABC transporter permease [Virgisporangium aliadipatigenens]GIJ48478.1 ABC transporter permease [Virgisporangium aliadipatigenens]
MTSFWTTTKLVAAREIQVRLRDKTFLYGTLFFLFFTVAITVLPAIFAGSPDEVAVAGSNPAVQQLRDAGLDVRVVADDAAAEKLVRDGAVDGAVVTTNGKPEVLAMDDVPGDIVSALSVQPGTRLLDPEAIDSVVRVLVTTAFGMIFFFTAVGFGAQIAMSVTEEKQTRIVEILVAAVPVRALLAGKVLGCGILAMGQIAVLALVAFVGMNLTGDSAVITMLAPALGWFVPFFIVGFTLLASLWAVAGSLVSRTEDIGQTTMPVQMCVLLPFFGVIFLNDNQTAMTVLSYFPFSAPMAMPLRLFFGDAAVWEPVLALVVLVASCAACLAVGARLYEGSLLRTNGRTSLLTAWRSRG